MSYLETHAPPIYVKLSYSHQTSPNYQHNSFSEHSLLNKKRGNQTRLGIFSLKPSIYHTSHTPMQNSNTIFYFIPVAKNQNFQECFFKAISPRTHMCVEITINDLFLTFRIMLHHSLHVLPKFLCNRDVQSVLWSLHTYNPIS